MPAPDKIEKLNYNFDERCKNLYIDTKSKFKNFIRFDTQKDIAEKEALNKKIDILKQNLQKTQKAVNVYVDLYNNLEKDFETTIKDLRQKESNSSNLENKLKSVSDTFNLKHNLFLKIQEYVNSIPENVDKLLEKANSIHPVTSTKTTEVSDRIQDILQIIKKYKYHDNLYQNEINELYIQRDMYNDIQNRILIDNQIRKKTTEYIYYEIELKKVDSYIKGINEVAFNNGFYEILKFRQTGILKDLCETWKEIKNTRHNMKTNALKNYAVITSKSFLNKLKKSIAVCTNSLIKMVDDMNKQKNYGDGLFKGFFTFLSTKQKQIKNYETQIDNIYKTLQQNLKTADIIKMNMMDLAKYLFQNSNARNQTAKQEYTYMNYVPYYDRHGYLLGLNQVPTKIEHNVNASKKWFNDNIVDDINDLIEKVNTRMEPYIKISEELNKHIKDANKVCVYVYGKGINAKGLKLTGLIDPPPEWKPIETIKEFDIK